MLVAGARAVEGAVVRGGWSGRDAEAELPGLADGLDWWEEKTGIKFDFQDLDHWKDVMPPPEMGKTWGMGRRG